MSFMESNNFQSFSQAEKSGETPEKEQMELEEKKVSLIIIIQLLKTFEQQLNVFEGRLHREGGQEVQEEEGEEGEGSQGPRMRPGQHPGA